MAAMAAHSVDAVVCDPPYGTTRNAWDAVIPFAPMWEQLHRIVRPGGAMVFTASQPFSSALVMSNPREFRHEWVWHKDRPSGHLNANRAPLKAHELVLVFCASAPFYAPQKTTGHKPSGKFYTRHGGNNYGKEAGAPVRAGGGSTERYPRTVQHFQTVNNYGAGKLHPTQKPVALMEYLLRTYTRAGDVVLDFAMGSGTTGEACRNTGRQFIGVESGAAEFSQACARLGAFKPDQQADNDNAPMAQEAAA